MKKQVGAFDEAAATLKNAAWWCTDEGDKLGAKERLLAAQLLRVAGRADAGVGLYQGVPIGEYFLRGDSEDKLARIILRAQTLQGKAQERTLAGKSK